MISFPNIKINLGLNVVSRRPDGYHNIETVFYPVRGWYDALEIVPAEKAPGGFFPTGIPVPDASAQNLVMKALALLKADYDIPEIDVHLHKNIPLGAGLGGGSSDAAFMLSLLNDFAALRLSGEQLERYASRLGADCPFFIRNQPVFAEGTGNVFTPVAVALRGYCLVVVKPDIHVSTQEAYAGVTPRQPVVSIREIIRQPVSRWKDRLANDFEESVLARHPEIGAIKQRMYDRGAVYASMSGSGSSVFGLFEEAPLPNGEWSLIPAHVFTGII
ncbi:MAG: 4-(cytidine 5'-diphospho)-2-C-methyl-D-erythritol kinase [Dysgonamonadaceae bacterium]|jgi:4-diphosphocytidyl-2-C-methyl-D-erythritol kinase|nr:4-(cytidine 5'-diphospho)-2-C-methyl-D-erythritol kinase [Dysgonamonadaceae bacterium]